MVGRKDARQHPCGETYGVDPHSHVIRGWKQILFAAGLVLALSFIWYARRVLLLAFSGLLISLAITSIIGAIRRVIPIKQGVGVGLVVLLAAGLGSLVGWWIAPGLAEEFSQLAEQVPKKAAELTQWAETTPVFKRFKESAPEISQIIPSTSGVAGKMKTVFTSTLDTIASVILVIFVALFLASNPGLYRRMVIRLFPPKRRRDANAVLNRLICTLKFWLLGQFISMCLVGVLVGISFALCGLPLSAALGVLAGVGEFIPFIGPAVAAAPAMLMGLSISGKLFLIVLGVYLAIQFVEGHFLMPIVQHRTVDLPPVATLLAVFLLGKFFGLLGMFVAAPLTASAIVLIEEIYLKRHLRDDRPLAAE